MNRQHFPTSWRVVPFLEVVSDKTGGNPRIRQREYQDNGRLPVIDQGQKDVAGYVDDMSLRCKAPLPCVIFGDHTKVLKFVETPFAIGADGVKVLVPSRELNPRYLFHYLKQIRFPKDTGYSRHFKFLKEAPIPVPPLDTQKRIVDALDKAQELINKRKQQIEMLDEFLQSVFLDMFGDPFKNTKQWATGTIRDVVSNVKYGTSKKAKTKDGQYPILRMNNITYSGAWDFTDLKYIDLEENELEQYLVRSGDILFNRTNSRELVGKTAVYRQNYPMAYAGYLIRVRANDKANPEFIAAYLNTRYGKLVLEHMCRNIIGMANINAQELQDITIYIPPIILQDEFARIVKTTNAQKQLLESGLLEMHNAFNSIMQRAFKGELFN